MNNNEIVPGSTVPVSVQSLEIIKFIMEHYFKKIKHISIIRGDGCTLPLFKQLLSSELGHFKNSGQYKLGYKMMYTNDKKLLLLLQMLQSEYKC